VASLALTVIVIRIIDRFC